MRVLLDTNVVIHRENKRVSNYSIGHLFRWLDRLKFEKLIHPLTISEIEKYRDPETQSVLKVKLEAYEVMKTVREPDESFMSRLGEPARSENDHVDNCLLYEVYLGRVDILITEDKKMRAKAVRLGIENRVFSIDGFINKVTADNPTLIEYKALSVEKTYFGSVDINDSFFDSFKRAYDGFEQWFVRKCNEEAYICRSDSKILGFLYLKTEGYDENYSDIVPPFSRKRRLKVGTFKVESTGFRLGERFIKIIFDNALERKVDEIYVTLFQDNDNLVALEALLTRWGFTHYGKKINGLKEEEVLIKRLNVLTEGFSPRCNFPNIAYHCNKFILPIKPQYHTTLLPDSQLKTENRIDFLGYKPHRYALQKVYITWSSSATSARQGDLLLLYRMGREGEIKKYKSVLSTIALVDDIIGNIRSENELFALCQNRSVFEDDELRKFWRNRDRANLSVVKFIFVKSLTKRLTLEYLWNTQVVPVTKGPRPFTKLTDEQFDRILRDSETEITFL